MFPRISGVIHPGNTPLILTIDLLTSWDDPSDGMKKKAAGFR